MTSTAAPNPRTARDGSTEQTILDAAADIIATDDFESLSMRRVASRAGVSLSTVVRHFKTKDALLAALVAQGGDDETAAHRAAIEPGDLAAAVHAVVADYEAAGPQLLHMLAQEHRFPALSELLDIGRRGHRSWVRQVFAPQLGARSGSARSRLEDLLVVATDVYTWKLLRLDRGLGARATESAMTQMCESLVA